MVRGASSLVLVLVLGACDTPSPTLADAGFADVPLLPACWVEAEVCDGEDDDCDGVVDEAVTECDSDHARRACVDAACVPVGCELGWGDCDADDTNGCEVRLSVEAHCGACGVECLAREICVLGECTVTAGDVAVNGWRGVAVGPAGTLYEWHFSASPVAVEGARFIQVGAGNAHFCARSGAGEVYCWGVDEYGELGRPRSELADDSPRRVSLPEPARDLAVSDSVGCAVGISGRAYCWGRGEEGQLGVGPLESPQPTPLEVRVAMDFERVDVGETHACGLRATGEVACWGAAQDYQIPGPDAFGRAERASVATGARAIGVAQDLSCAILEDRVHCRGFHSDGEKHVWFSQELLPWPGTEGARAIDVDATHALIATSDRLFVSRHRVADGPGPQAELREVAGLGRVVAFSTYADRTCALDEHGRVYCGDLVEAPELMVELPAE